MYIVFNIVPCKCKYFEVQCNFVMIIFYMTMVDVRNILIYHVFSTQTMFINDQSQEYQFFEITYKATRPGTITTIELTTPVRQSVPYTITLENPLSYQVAFTVSCNITEIQMPSQLHVSAQNEVHFM